MTIGDWFHEFEQEAVRSRDKDRLRLLQHYHMGYQLRERDPDQAFHLFSEARDLAKQIGEPWMALFFDEWRVTALLHFKRDFRTVLDLAVASALEARKPQYAQYSGRWGIFDNLIAAYVGIDPGGHAEAIQQAIDYMDREVPNEPNSIRYLLIARQRIMALDLRQIDRAHELCLRELALADEDRDSSRSEHFSVFTYCALCQIAHARQDWDNLAEWSTVGDAITRRVGHQIELAELLAWRAVVAQHAGEADKAVRLARSANSRMKGQRMPPTNGFYDGLSAYHDMIGDREGVLAVRDRELNDVAGWGRFLTETHCRIKRLRLLKDMGRPVEADAEAARESARRLGQPEEHLQEIERIVG